MKRKPNFVKSTGPYTYLKDEKSFDKGIKFMEHRHKMKLIMPDRAIKKNIPKWNL